LSALNDGFQNAEQFRFRNKLANLSSGRDPNSVSEAQYPGESNPAQLFGFLNGFQSICPLPTT
jgi:hypothetical protein